MSPKGLTRLRQRSVVEPRPWEGGGVAAPRRSASCWPWIPAATTTPVRCSWRAVSSSCVTRPAANRHAAEGQAARLLTNIANNRSHAWLHRDGE